MTKTELTVIFDEVRKEIYQSLDSEKIQAELSKQLDFSSLSEEDGKKLGTIISFFTELNQQFLFRVLVKIFENQKNL